MDDLGMENLSEDITQGLEEISVGSVEHENENDEGNVGVEEEEDNDELNGSEDYGIPIDGENDFADIDISSLSVEEIMQYHFPNLEVAYAFYNWYGLMKGFSARKWNMLKNKKGEVVQQTFVCHKEGFRLKKHVKKINPKREPRTQTRCGCEAEIRVHVAPKTGRWHVTFIYDVHNHKLLDAKYMGMLPAHRKMSDSDVMQMNSMRNDGISTSHIHGTFASQSGGYQRIGFRKQDMYNEQQRQRRLQKSDVRAGFGYLRKLRSTDPAMFWRHTVDEENRLQHLFWSDGSSQEDYAIFGDVIAFDATYSRNKYMCPLVVFSGVNHHNQTIIFGAGLVSNETEETYTWLLLQFVQAMKGKKPSSVITDGDLAMRNAIRTVFPNAHHRLCAWHLMRNAATNIGKRGFTEKFRKCMLGDYEVGQFKVKWDAMVREFDVEHHPWIIQTYEKRNMWATAHIRGSFFAGFRTTSRCEGLHSLLGKFVHSRNNLAEFLQHFMRCLNFMRFREVEADFASVLGDPVLQTPFPEIEQSAAKVFTKEVFFMFRGVMMRARRLVVDGCKVTPMCFIYNVRKQSNVNREWHVLVNATVTEVKCSCQRMESLGIACEHIVIVLVYLGKDCLPESLILKRWTKSVKDDAQFRSADGSSVGNPTLVNWYLTMLVECKRLIKVAIRREQRYYNTVEKIRNETATLEAESGEDDDDDGGENADTTIDANIRDPVRVRSKGCASAMGSKAGPSQRSASRCSLCREPGHNRRKCPIRTQMESYHPPGLGNGPDVDGDDDVNFYEEDTNVDTCAPHLHGEGVSQSYAAMQ